MKKNYFIYLVLVATCLIVFPFIMEVAMKMSWLLPVFLNRRA